MESTEQNQKFTLDSSLRNMYLTLRKEGCLLMAIEFEHKGVKYRTDSVQEAVSLQAGLTQYDFVVGSHGSENTPRVWTADLAMDLLNNIGELQKKFLAALSNGANLSSSSLVEVIGVESEIALAGVISGLSKQLRKMSANSASLYSVEVVWKGKGKTRFFKLSSDFRDTLIELGWPEAWQTGKGKDETAPTKKRVIL
ncbi:MAG: hypothetical protein P4K93_06740 [Terracidiphilus sp.]|nr:hypothetical protein [Terracidiphilus sp.]